MHPRLPARWPTRWPPPRGACAHTLALPAACSGSSDIIAGAITGPAAFLDGLMDFHTGSMMLLGPTMDPKVASELMMRLPHLPCRMQVGVAGALGAAGKLGAAGVLAGGNLLPCFSHPRG